MATEPEMEVEVAYARADTQVLIKVRGPAGMTLEQAIRRSGVLEHFPEIDLDGQKVGVFGKAKDRDTVLHSGDRVEIYRPLIADPKEARKRRAAEGKPMGKGKSSAE